ncbi:conserved hypothetical protein [Solidesulfovibrio fructosivorans JJ]]|uniref:Hydrophobic domain protein n=1 Tax=Solidesulfovibrio fructosivorans JJ] TaxID=596151 RepID=E1JRF9_SOLFR|nr:DUF389 domain-containing protein [Solidesulfovibrio fructosivorans]EFL53160.1 conserved hypothetical protein [Solidesulfovibrio fructosivorans JJ]]
MNDRLRTILARCHISDKRCEDITEEITRGSTPGAGFYALIAAASLIASLGLVANSPAVIIGAMLVSPLMSPIFGISLGMIRGDAALLGKSLRAEISGMVLAVAFGALFGLLPVMTEVTPEMLARTEPTLLDLLVAVFAGFAGTLAMVDTRISPALPGVAIATAIVPPLTTCGLCLAANSPQGASGAFLLFFANFVAILLVSALTFLAAGLARSLPQAAKRRGVAGNLAIAILCFLLVSAYLTHTLSGIVRDRNQDSAVKATLERILGQDPNASLVLTHRKNHQNGLDVLASIRTPKPFTPQRVAAMEKALEQELGEDVRLVTRCLLTKDIFPPGGAAVVTVPSLDGSFITDKVPTDVKRLQLAEQTLRELFSTRPQLLLLDVDLVHIAGDPVILATLQSPRPLVAKEAQAFEQAIRDRLGDPRIRLLARCQVPVDVTATGRILFGRAHFGPPTPEADKVAAALRQDVQALPNMFVTSLDVVRKDDGYAARAEVVGPRLLTPKEIRDIETRVTAMAGAPVHLAAWSKVELMVTDARYTSLDDYTSQRLSAAEEAAPTVVTSGQNEKATPAR